MKFDDRHYTVILPHLVNAYQFPIDAWPIRQRVLAERLFRAADYEVAVTAMCSKAVRFLMEAVLRDS